MSPLRRTLLSWALGGTPDTRRPLRSSMLLAGTLFGATIVLVFIAYQATSNLNRSAQLLVERRTGDRLALLWAGLTQDMKGAQATVLVQVTPNQLLMQPPYDLADIFARGFARFPYPESFFAWVGSGGGERRDVRIQSSRSPSAMAPQ